MDHPAHARPVPREDQGGDGAQRGHRAWREHQRGL